MNYYDELDDYDYTSYPTVNNPVADSDYLLKKNKERKDLQMTADMPMSDPYSLKNVENRLFKQDVREHIEKYFRDNEVQFPQKKEGFSNQKCECSKEQKFEFSSNLLLLLIIIIMTIMYFMQSIQLQALDNTLKTLLIRHNISSESST